jgi:hypothetical protein
MDTPNTALAPQQCKDLPAIPVLRFLAGLDGRWATIFKGPDEHTLFENSIWHVLPAATPVKVVRAKVKNLLARGLIDGCACGCRGDLVLTAKGAALLASA